MNCLGGAVDVACRLAIDQGPNNPNEADLNGGDHGGKVGKMLDQSLSNSRAATDSGSGTSLVRCCGESKDLWVLNKPQDSPSELVFELEDASSDQGLATSTASATVTVEQCYTVTRRSELVQSPLSSDSSPGCNAFNAQLAGLSQEAFETLLTEDLSILSRTDKLCEQGDEAELRDIRTMLRPASEAFQLLQRCRSAASFTTTSLVMLSPFCTPHLLGFFHSFIK